ncbi:MAG: amino acid adenylation domain-containing protein, partial [Blastocatellia bacterium]
MNPKITTTDPRLPDSVTGAMPASGERLSADERRRLLDTLLRNRAASSGSQSRIPKLPRNDGVNVFAASFAQERLWFFTQLETNSPFYNQTLGIMARGRLNEAVLKESLSLIAKRHETMRTTFVVEDHRLVQIVSPDCSAHLDVIDLTTLPSGEREAARQEIASAETHRPFDLAQGPVLRSTIVRLGEEESFLMFSAHHIVTDYWGLSVFLTELTEVYSSLSEGLEPDRAAPIIQYADFAMWHRDWMRSGVYEKQLAYWKKQLEGAETLRLPTDFERPPIQAFRGAIFRWPLGAELASKVRAFSDGNGVTLYMALLTAFKVLLQRYSGQQEVIVGTPIANRSLLELERIIGFFSNTLVLRTELGRDISFRGALDKVKEVCLAAYIHQDLPFEKLVEELQPERDLSRNPLFQVMFRLQTNLHSSLELKGLSLSQVWDDDVESGARFDLELAIRDDKEDLIATLEYNTDLFTPATIERISRHYQYLLTYALSDPNRPISMLPVAGEDEREQLLNEWNKTEFDYGERLFTHEMFQQQARQHPQAVALEFEDRQMSYAELNEKANQLAHYLQRQGVGPESVVGVYLERSMEMVIALLGVMKAGGAYLPIDVSYPAERVLYMLEDAGAKVVLTQEGLRQAIAGARAKVASVDGLSDEIRSESGEDAGVELGGGNLAYVIYTSGSTGRPKGAMNTHGAIRNRLLWMQQAYQLDSTDRVLQKTPFSFDVSVWEFFWPLMTGATLVIVSPGGHRDSQYLARLIAEKQITTVHFVPSMLAVFLQEPEAVDCRNLKRVICSGEALGKELSARCLRILPADLHNLYGPTEAAIDVTYWHCKPEDRRPAIPIGKPIANTQMYVVDENFDLLPIGMGGELCIGGVGLARGYLNSPGLTADKFVADPFSSRAGARMYRTGDLARWATDGNLDFLGRIDSQVKIRGFRIEPGEIEATLTQHPAVEHAVAAIYPDGSGGHRIVAYVVPDEVELGGKRGLQTEQVNQWQAVWNETYDPGANIADPTFNIAGWKSSYSNQLMSDEEMREWLGRTVDRILALRPRRAIEIGCGTGMLLFRIAPHCEEYWASDFSQEALNYIQKHAETLSGRLPIANLLCREASVFDGLDESSFDTIILNSVVQYFPALEYLTQVLEGAIRIGSAGGTIFIGDVRSLPLLEAMHASVLLSQANDGLDADKFVQLWRSAIKQEEELVVSQAYFAMLKQKFPKISHVEIKPKRGWHENEMNRFRYDVVIHLGTRPDFITPSRTIDWSKEMLDLSGITQMLCEQQPDSLVITGVPNSRLHSDVAAVRMLRNIDGIQTVGELRQVTNGSARKGIHPEELWSLGDQLSYQVDLSWHGGRSDGSFDIAFLKRENNHSNGKTALIEWPSANFEGRPSSELANNPLRQKSTGNLEPELRRFAERKLPEYMVPSSFVLLDALPLNANGKLDRKALKPPERKANATTKYVAPRTPLEETVCGIWEYILRLDRVGVEHNFFELGGHSLLATQVISRIRTVLSVKLPLQAIFKHPTVSKLALQIELARRQQKQSIEPPLVRIDHKEPPPLSFAQQRLWFLDQLEPGSVYNMPGAVRLRGELDVAALRRSISEIIRRHEVLRTSFPQREGQPFQQINPACELDMPVIDLSEEALKEAEATAQRVVGEETQQGFDLRRGPMLRAKLIRIREADHVLVVTMHHVASDGWSVGILIREFTKLYRAYSEGEETGVEEMRLQYADFAVWQREYLKGEVLEEQMKYWKGQLEGVSAL